MQAATVARERPDKSRRRRGKSSPEPLRPQDRADRHLWSEHRDRGGGPRPPTPGAFHMTTQTTLSELESSAPFASRHIGPDAAEQQAMLSALGFESLDDLVSAAMPDRIRAGDGLDLPPAMSEVGALEALRALAARNNPLVPMIGLGYSGTVTPAVVRRNVLEDPSWYTAYTPYQPEISQGRLEALLNFQTMVGDLAGLPTANASLLDEGTAAAEAMTLVRRANRSNTGPFVVDANSLPQTIAVVETRARAMGIDVV